MKGIVVITGASSGIGRQTAISLAQEGYPLLLLARRIEKMEELKLPNTLCKKVDIEDKASFKAAIEEAKAKFKSPIEALINNAGVMLLGNVVTQSDEEWQKMININLIGMLNGIKLVLADMIKDERGSIINISSIAGKKTFPNHAVYCATKFAVHALTEGIREEVSGSNVRLITIAPGVVETELLSHTSDAGIIDGYKDWKKNIDGGLSPQVVADSIIFALKQPQSVCIREIVMAPTKQQA